MVETQAKTQDKIVQIENIFQLGREAARGLSGQVNYREDGAVWMALGSSDPHPAGGKSEGPRFVHYHPLKDDSIETAQARVRELHARFPQAPVHGFSPAWFERQGAREVIGLNSLCWFTGSVDGPAESASSGWQKLADTEIAKVASFIYGPEVTREQVEARVGEILKGRNVTTIVPLPRGLGDRVLLAQATTDGILDVTVYAWTRIACARHDVRLRASWGALGWKMAQPCLSFGVDELAGWGLEEFLAYGPKARGSSVVGREEAEQGIREAGREPIGVTACASGS